MTRFILLFFALVYSTMVYSASGIKPISNGPLHEAFITNPYGLIPLESIEAKPPEPIAEDTPFQVDIQAAWIRGYWEWMPATQDFIWVTGVWRRPPPGMRWIPGSWKKFEQGWVRIPGFWSAEPLEALTVIGQIPPDPIAENPGFPPIAESFWMPGYWNYFSDAMEYGWVPGSWQPIDPRWVLIPAHYIWRSEGYIFIPAYWDWPLTELGRAYHDVVIDPQLRGKIVFQPVSHMELSEALEDTFERYPDYLCYYQHHFHFNPKEWLLSRDEPSWWSLPSWWCFNWHDQWGLWWWYTHPGYPQPSWVTSQISQHIPKPPGSLIIAMKKIVPPLIVTPNGVVSPRQFLSAMIEVDSKAHVPTGKIVPILPSNPEIVQDIKNTARSAIKAEMILKPAGSIASIKTMTPQIVLQPFITLSLASQEQLKGKIVRPSIIKPVLPQKPVLESKPVRTFGKSPEAPVYKPEYQKPSFYEQQPRIDEAQIKRE